MLAQGLFCPRFTLTQAASFPLHIDLRGVPARESDLEPALMMLVTREDAVALALAHGVDWYARSVGYPLAGGCADLVVLPSSFMHDQETNRKKRRLDGVCLWFEAREAALARGLPQTLAQDEADKTPGAVRPAVLADVPAHANGPAIVDPGQSPALWEGLRAWVTRIVGTPPRLGEQRKIPWIWLVVPGNWSPPDESLTFDTLPSALTREEMRDLASNKAKDLRRRREGRKAVDASYLALRELGFTARDIRNQFNRTDFEPQIADARAYGRSYALRTTARLWAAGRGPDLRRRGLHRYRNHAAAALALTAARRAKADVGSHTPDMAVLATVGERMARGRTEENIPIVAHTPVRLWSGPHAGKTVPLYQALHSGEWFGVSDELFRAHLGDWAAREGHTVAAEPWRCKVTHKEDGTWVRPTYNVGTLIQSMYGVGRPQTKRKRHPGDGPHTTLWRFSAAQIRQRLRDQDVHAPVDFNVPDELIEAIAQDDPWRNPTPRYVPILQGWRGDAHNIRPDDPEFEDRARAMARIKADLPIAVDVAKMKEIIAELPPESRAAAKAALREGKDQWRPAYAYSDNGRITSNKPNIQGIPAACREAVIIPDGHEVVDVDLVSAHANIAALIAEDDVLARELQTTDVYQKLADTLDIERGGAKMRFLAWINGNEDDMLDAYISVRYPRLHRYIAAVDINVPEQRTRLAATWSEVEGSILTHVIARLPEGLRLIAPMHDGLVYWRPKARADLDAQVVALWQAGARSVTGVEEDWKVKVTVSDRWR